MKNFRLLFKHERRSLFPTVKHKKLDIIGGLLSAIVSLVVIAAFALMIYAVAESYVTVKVDKVSDPTARAHEFLNALYSVIILALGFMCLEKLRTNLVRKTDRALFLRLPIKQSTIFFAKFAALLLWNYVTAFFLVIPVNLIFYIVLKPGMEFWLHTALVYLLLPLAAFLIATILIVPYVYLINFLSHRYFIAFITVSALVVGAFLIYSRFLSALQGLFEKNTIKFLFNTTFVGFLQTLKKFSYPANSLASIALGQDMLKSIIIAGATAIVALVVVFVSTNALYKLTLYRNAPHVRRGRRRMIKRRSVLGGLMRKEFISVFREPKHMFSYFSIALSMPFMVYCCYTLFDTLIFNAIGFRFEFSLALMVILVFTILTNTFCATNITRDGLTALKAKMFPIKASKILFAKVLFCGIISSLSVLASTAVIFLTSNLKKVDGTFSLTDNFKLTDIIVVAAIGLIFSLSQILIATRMDLNHALLTASPSEIARVSNKTIAKTITLGLFFALIIGVLSIFIALFAGQTTPDFLFSIDVKESYTHIIPLAIAVFYFFISLLYYSVRIEKSFNKLVR